MSIPGKTQIGQAGARIEAQLWPAGAVARLMLLTSCQLTERGPESGLEPREERHSKRRAPLGVTLCAVRGAVPRSAGIRHNGVVSGQGAADGTLARASCMEMGCLV